jgi:predicted nucleic acid-binding protein
VKYILDTNVLSELGRRTPNERVAAWFAQVSEEDQYISVLSLGELRLGVERLADSSRKEDLRHWLEHELTAQFQGRILPVDIAAANRWGSLEAAAGRSLPTADALIAATALCLGHCVVTRNTKDFNHPGLVVIDPWQFV